MLMFMKPRFEILIAILTAGGVIMLTALEALASDDKVRPDVNHNRLFADYSSSDYAEHVSVAEPLFSLQTEPTPLETATSQSLVDDLRTNMVTYDASALEPNPSQSTTAIGLSDLFLLTEEHAREICDICQKRSATVRVTVLEDCNRKPLNVCD